MMQNNILFFQSTTIGSNLNDVGLLELLFTHFDALSLDIFEQIQIIVPNSALAIWLKDQFALKYGICANLDCIVLPGPVLDNIYLANNKNHTLFNFAKAKYIIYEYLCNNQLDDADELNNYIYTNGVVDKFRTYQLATQLYKIFHEYLYLRTEELINLDKSAIKSWQKQIIRHLFIRIGEEKTFLDIYRYFMINDIREVNLPKQLFVFGLTSIYQSQLQILARISINTHLYWYYQTCSYNYYGDLLSDKVRSTLERRLLKKPDLSLDDLYILDGNPLLANLAQQSREFTELLIANDIEVYSVKRPILAPLKPMTVLWQIQEDIREIKHRIHSDYRFESALDVYADPIELSLDNGLYDLPCSQSSVKINICHNRMREVQVMFNELIELLNKNPEFKLTDILITAPDIDDYAPYISAVFDNETVNQVGQYNRLLYNITGNRKYKNYKVLETLKILLNTPYIITVSYLIEILIQTEIQTNLEISNADVLLVKEWLHANNTHFGYDKNDYTNLGYVDYQIYSFKQFLNNLVLGACISSDVWGQNPPLYVSTDKYVPYDNLDNNQIELCNKLIMLIEYLEELRCIFYINEFTYKEITIGEIHKVLSALNSSWLSNKNAISISEYFLGELLEIDSSISVTLPILNLMLDEYIDDFKSGFTFNGNITCASMRYMRNIPYKATYILGLNFGEYPNSFTSNQLSILSHDWYLADRNYNVEDKQTFLDIVLACNWRLYLSYIGRQETDNSEIKPSPLLGLLIDTIRDSFTNLGNLLTLHALHPFYNNKEANYSKIWADISRYNASDFIDKVWDFEQTSPLKLPDKSVFYTIDISKITRLFLYSNVNLYASLGINNFDSEPDLSDSEDLTLANRSLAKIAFKYFEKYLNIMPNNLKVNHLEDLMRTSGVLGYKHIGHIQFNYYYGLYQEYVAKRGVLAKLTLLYKINDDITLNIIDDVHIENDKIIITDNFINISATSLASKLSDLPYALKIRALVVYLLWAGLATIKLDGKVIEITGLIIRQLTVNGESADFNVVINQSSHTLNLVLKYYVRSLANPILIHKGAIEEYTKLRGEDKPINECISKARVKYDADFNNYDLDKIRQDIVFANIADNYFDFMNKINGVNDIVRIGEILATLHQI